MGDTIRLIELVGGHANAVMDYRVFPESKTAKEKMGAAFRSGDRLPRMKYRGTLTEYASCLQQRNRQGCGVFYCLNTSDGKGVKNANITAVRTLPLDLDNSKPPAVWAGDLRPHCLLETSPGRWQALFMIEPTTDFDKAAQTVRRLALLYGGDPSVADRARVMRLPGFIHRKAKAFRSRIIDIDHFAEPYPLDDFDVVLPPLPARRASSGRHGVGLIDARRAALIFKHYPVEALSGNAAWQKFAMALHSACNADEEVAEMFFEFCATDSAYGDADERNRMRWDSFTADREGGLKIGALRWLCANNGVPGAVRFTIFNEVEDVGDDFDASDVEDDDSDEVADVEG
jgi:hypothetical protein